MTITAAPLPTTPADTVEFLVADLFCGAGGSSTGAQKAINSIGGHMNLVAVNHWPVAIATHEMNHPAARHYVQDVELADPEKIVPEGRLDILMASPECRFYSRARGGKPTKDQGRMSPWSILNWLTKLNIRCVLVENVPEFVNWGPLNDDMKPDKTQRGKHFQTWFMNFLSLGYNAEWRMLNAANFGDATTRTRFFLMARNDGLPIIWPEPTHTHHGQETLTDSLPKWRGAREIIDWSDQGRSLLDDPKYLKKPLSIKTRRRIARGLQKYGGSLAHLYIRLLDLPEYDGHTLLTVDQDTPFIVNRHSENGSLRCHPVDQPAPIATCRGSGYVLTHAAEPLTCANRTNNVPKDLTQPLHGITTTPPGGGIFYVEPSLEAAPETEDTREDGILLGQQSPAAPRDAAQPLPTAATQDAISLTRTMIVNYYGQSNCSDADAPLTAITAQARKHALTQPVIVQYYTHSDCSNIDKPLPPVTTHDRHALCQPTVLQVNYPGTQNDDEHRVQTVDQPVPALTSKRNLALAEATIVQIDHEPSYKTDDRRAKSVDDPLSTIVTKNNLGLAQPIIVQTGQTDQTGDNAGYTHPVSHPTPTITTKNDINLTTPDTTPYSVQQVDMPQQLDQHTLEHLRKDGIDPRRLVLINGVPHVLDIRFRMLHNAELARAMGFNDEDTTYEFTGTISQVTKQIGNAVPVNLSAALVKAALSQHTPNSVPAGATP